MDKQTVIKTLEDIKAEQFLSDRVDALTVAIRVISESKSKTTSKIIDDYISEEDWRAAIDINYRRKRGSDDY